ncbi:MAG: xanthine dehydrogenase family protein molybdopterin-binding subunit, partial [Dehalococcoidia bacterium]|nr:xanthine dehydrogenase family protein molybdopterin-binding subunit [Dehalococcoidia bacterium]
VLPNMLRGKVLRSPHPHARILNIDTSLAERAPGVMAVASARDLPLVRYGSGIQDETAFAVDRVRYMGEAVAAVAATDLDAAREALKLIRVEYEELPAVFDPFEALKPGSPLVHEELHTYKHLPVFKPVEGTNVAYHYRLRQGDVETGFAESDFVMEDTYQAPMAQHGYIEPPVAVCWFDPQGRATVWTPSPKPFGLRAHLAAVFQLPLSKVRVMTCRVGGSFGGKGDARLEHIGLALARKAGRPVKLSMTRTETFTSSLVRHPVIIRVKTGARKDGTLRASEMEIVWNTGAYCASGAMVCKNSGHGAPGPYLVPHVKVDAFTVYTNNPISGGMRGFGSPQLAFAVESQMDELAERLGMDPVELRLKNAVEEGSLSYDGQRLHSVGLKDTIRAVASRTEERRGRLAPGWGTGFACSHKSCASGSSSSAFIKINEDGTVIVMSSTVEAGQGSDTIKAQIVAEEMGVRVEDVVVAPPDTDTTPYDFGTVASRSTFHMGNAVRLAAADARQKLFQAAADRLEANSTDLEAADGMVRVKGSPDRGVSIAVLAAESVRRLGPILGQATYIHKIEAPGPGAGKPAEPSNFFV